MSGTTKERADTEPTITPAANHCMRPDAATRAVASPAQTWTISTANGYVLTGYLPQWAEEDPSAAAVPPQQLGSMLVDVNHHRPFPGQRMTVALTDSPGTGTVVLGGSIDCAPYSEDPATRLPVVNLQLVDDYWLHNLDPDEVAAVSAQLRAQADHLDHQVRPALIAARDDWTTHHNT